MKNLILIALLFIAFPGKAQTTKPIDGFLGIKFGSSAAEVTAAMKTKGSQVSGTPTVQSIGFSNVTLGNRKVSALFVHFVNDKAYEAAFVFRPDLEAKTIEYYDALVTDINGVYGTGKPSKTFKQPYTDGDGYEITALKTGNATYETNWDVAENYITATILAVSDGELRIRLFYNDGKLTKLYEDQVKEKNKSEF